jgi:hypothetical protein
MGGAQQSRALGGHDERDEAKGHVANGQGRRAQQEQIHGGLRGKHQAKALSL